MTLRFHFTRQPPRTVINLVQGIRVGLGVVVNYRCVTSIILKRINVNQVAKEAMVYTGQVSREPYNDVGWNRGYSIAVPIVREKAQGAQEDQLIPREDSTSLHACVLPLSPLHRGSSISGYIYIYSTSQPFSSCAIAHATWAKFTVGQIAGNKRLQDWDRFPIQRRTNGWRFVVGKKYT